MKAKLGFTFFGAISLMYKITIADSKPTPSPATKRPPTKVLTLVEAVCTMTPIMKITQPARIVVLLPKKSAQSPAIMAPKNVPVCEISAVGSAPVSLRTG